MESLASHEAAQELATKKNFRERNAVKITAPLCPTLKKQLQSIRSYKQYLTDSLHDLNLLIQQKVREVKNLEDKQSSAAFSSAPINMIIALII